MSTSPPVYPLQLEGEKESPLNRWLWLVKWLLLIPHAITLVVLWIGVVVSTVITFFAILITGRYPRGLFDHGESRRDSRKTRQAPSRQDQPILVGGDRLLVSHRRLRHRARQCGVSPSLSTLPAPS
jgi:hypothetical protein